MSQAVEFVTQKPEKPEFLFEDPVPDWAREAITALLPPGEPLAQYWSHGEDPDTVGPEREDRETKGFSADHHEVEPSPDTCRHPWIPSGPAGVAAGWGRRQLLMRCQIR
jgi:hypothetical protein